MKRLSLILLVIFIVGCQFSFAQILDNFYFKGIAKNKLGQTLSNTKLPIKISIIDNNIDGKIEYIESQIIETNNEGLFSTSIGKGKVVIGDLSKILWSKGLKYVKVEIILSKNGYSNRILESIKLIDVISSAKHNISLREDECTKWICDDYGIYTESNVGIGKHSEEHTPLVVKKTLSNTGYPTVIISSEDSWQTKVDLVNMTDTCGYQIVIGGSANPYYKKGLGILSTAASNSFIFPLMADVSGNVAIGSAYTNPMPKSRLHVHDGDVYIDQIGKGVIMKSPNGNCWKLTIDNNGNLVTTSITCP